MAAGCPCRERHEASVADTSPVREGLLASADSNKVAAKSPVLLTSRDFALAEAWCFGNLPMVGQGPRLTEAWGGERASSHEL